MTKYDKKDPHFAMCVSMEKAVEKNQQVLELAKDRLEKEIQRQIALKKKREDAAIEVEKEKSKLAKKAKK